MVAPKEEKSVVGYMEEIPVVVKEKVYRTQFHPEKSRNMA